MVADPPPSARDFEQPMDNDLRFRQILLRTAAQLTLVHAAEVLAAGLANALSVPLALLSRDDLSWRLEGQAFAESSEQGSPLALEGHSVAADPAGRLQEASGHAWTAISLGRIDNRDWALLLPGPSATWAGRPDFD